MLKLFRRHASFNNGQILKLRPEREQEPAAGVYEDDNDYGQEIGGIADQQEYEDYSS